MKLNRKVTATTCPYCGVGCGVNVTQLSESKFSVDGNKMHPANYGRLCTKGMQLANTLDTTTRLGVPEVNGEQTTWSKSIAYASERLLSIIKRYGPDAVAFYASGQLLTEDYYVANKLMKGFIGSGNIDTNSRLCMSSPVVAHKKAFGSDSVPVCYSDLEKTDLIVLVGSNLSWCHPVLFQRILAEKKRRPRLTLVVIDPRTTETAVMADVHLKINSGSDLLLFNGLLGFLADNDYVRKDFSQVNCLSEAISLARKDCHDLKKTSDLLGIELKQLVNFYQLFARHSKVVSVFSQGINQSLQGVDQCSAIINCHLATGRIGEEGAGPFSITGQPNAMGGREVGGLATSLAAHLTFGNPQHHQLLSEFWQTQNLATKPGATAVEIFQNIARKKIKAVWIMATNPVVSMPNNRQVMQALADCPLVIVSECFNTSDTLNFANVVFPACGWGEKSGTVTNSERRISRQRAFKQPHQQAKPDWWIICQVAKAMGYSKNFAYQSEAQIFAEHIQLSAKASKVTKSFNLEGLLPFDEVNYQSLPSFQWPQNQARHLDLGEQRLFTDGLFHTSDGLANAVPVSYFRAKPYRASRSIGNIRNNFFKLNSGRTRDQWHTLTRSSLANRLNLHTAEPVLSIHSQDALRLRIKTGDVVKIKNRFGGVSIRTEISNKTKPGEIFMPMHWTYQFTKEATVNSVVSSLADPQSLQPAFKHTSVTIEKSKLKSHAILASSKLLETDIFDYWVKQPFEQGYLYSLASRKDFSDFYQWLIEKLTNISECDSGYWLRGSDTNMRRFNYSLLNADRLQLAFQVSADYSELQLDWLRNVFNLNVNSVLKCQLISGSVDQSISATQPICLCKNLDSAQISEAMENVPQQSVEEVCAATGAASVCGTCIGDVGLLIANNRRDKKVEGF